MTFTLFDKERHFTRPFWLAERYPEFAFPDCPPFV